MRRADIIDWYLESKEDQMETEDDLDRERRTISLVLNRMVKNEFSLLQIKSTMDDADEEDPLLTVAIGASE